MRIWIDVCASVSATHESTHATYVEHAKRVRQAVVAPGQRTLNLVPLQVPLDERPVGLLQQEPVNFLVRPMNHRISVLRIDARIEHSLD